MPASEELDPGCDGVAFGIGHSPVIESEEMSLLIEIARDAREGMGIQNAVTFRRIVKEIANFHDTTQIDQAWVAAGGTAPLAARTGSSATGTGSLAMGQAFMDEVIKTSLGKANTDAEMAAREKANATNATKLPPTPQGTVAARTDHSQEKMQTSLELADAAVKPEDINSFVRGIVKRLARGGEVGTIRLTPKRLLELDTPEKFEAEVRRAITAGLGELKPGSSATGTGETNSQLDFFKEAVNTYLDAELSKYSRDAYKEVNLPKGEAIQGVMSGISRQNLMAEVNKALDGFGKTLEAYLISESKEVNLPKGDVKQEAIDLGRTNLGARTVFDWAHANFLGKRIANTYFPPSSPYRVPETPKDLAYYGGYIYERITKMDGKRPTFNTWVAYMKASTGHDITGGDLKTAWDNLRQVAFNTRVQPQVDIRNAAIKKANQLLSPEQLKQFLESTKSIDVNSPDAHAQYRQAINDLRSHDALAFVSELPGLRRAIRTSFDLSALLNQGNVYALNPLTPRRNKQNVMHMLKSFANEKYAEAAMADLWDSPTGKMIQKSNPGLLSTFGQDLPIQAREEAFATRLLDGIIRSSHDNEAYQAFSPAQSLPALAAITVGVPLALVTPPFIGIPATAIAAKLGDIAARKISWGGTRPIKSTVSLDLSTGVLNGLANKIQKSFEYVGHLGESASTWDKAVSFEIGLAGAIPKLNKALGNPSNTGIAGAVTSAMRANVRMMGGSERGYTVVLNMQRVQAYGEVADILIKQGILPDTHPEVFTSLGNIVGMLTGRADMGAFEDQMKTLSLALFSPRFQAANLQTLITAPVVVASSAAVDKVGGHRVRERIQGRVPKAYIPPQVRKHFIKSLGGWIAGMGTILALSTLAGAGVMLDPRHRDAYKMRFKNLVLDISGGKANYIRNFVQAFLFQQKMTSRKSSNPSGFVLPGDTSGMKLEDMDGKGFGLTVMEMLTQSFVGKANPSPIDIIQMTTGQDSFGRPIYRGRFKKNGPTDPEAWKEGFKDILYNFGPLTPVDFIEAMADEDNSITEKLFATLIILGANAQDTHFDKKALR